MRFIRDEYPEVIWERPPKTMWQLIEKHGMPPMRQRRYCCSELKEGGGSGRVVALGVRWAESSRRRSRWRLVQSCWRGDRRLLVCPIIDWSDSLVWEYVRARNLPMCSLYAEGFKRLGCILCPMQRTRVREADAARWPKYRNAYVRAFDRMIVAWAAKGRPRSWLTGEECYQWWISSDNDTPLQDNSDGGLFSGGEA